LRRAGLGQRRDDSRHDPARPRLHVLEQGPEIQLVEPGEWIAGRPNGIEKRIEGHGISLRGTKLGKITLLSTVRKGKHMTKATKTKVRLDTSIGVRLTPAEKAALERWAEKEERAPSTVARRALVAAMKSEGLLK
jgi:hypothetical protein